MKQNTRKWLAALRIGLGVGLLYYVLARTGASAAIRPLLGSSWLLAALFLLTLGGAAIEAARLVVLFRAAELKLSFGGAYRVVMIGTFFNFCIPGGTGGDVVKLYYLAAGNRRKGIEVATVLLV
ncbi:MAG: lysylphosphatidylglycerol synthase domain-containing protein, partial [Longimicrobiales bacterium]